MAFFSGSGRYKPLQSISGSSLHEDEEQTVFMRETLLDSSCRDNLSYADLTPDPNDDTSVSKESGWEENNDKVTFSSDNNAVKTPLSALSELAAVHSVNQTEYREIELMTSTSRSGNGENSLADHQLIMLIISLFYRFFFVGLYGKSIWW
jgi:hypothetical protein